MWHAIETIFTSQNALSSILFLTVCAIGGVVIVKSGMLQIHTSAIQISSADKERGVIKQQLDYVLMHLNSIEANLDKPKGYNEYLGRFIIEKAYDKYVQWIVINHISRSERYIKLKQDELVEVISQYTQKEEFKAPEFEAFIRDDTKQTLLALLEIREVYGK